MLKKHTIILFLLLALTVSCAINPVTGKKELMLYSEAAEINLGRQTDQQVRAMYGVYDDPAAGSVKLENEGFLYTKAGSYLFFHFVKYN